ncbi:MAG: 16S rRNA (uracil(1498)-N(3))-methyltransferase [Gammaproteobacteria bacterium]|nr:16S rRNA (uracil(1498)-N(3))-methyltransferase [Gammaproteobacteria bacterium]
MTRVLVAVPLVAGAELELPVTTARHLLQVLRLRDGAAITLFNGDGCEYPARLRVEGRRAVAVVLRSVVAQRESPLALTLAQCVSKGERMDYTIQKAVELGVTRLIPLRSTNSVVKLEAARWERKLAHWRDVIGAACEQSGRNRLPELAPVQEFSVWLTRAEGLRLVLDPRGGASLKTLPPTAAVSVLVGPEGGLAAAEFAAARDAGFRPLGLGPRVLRTETAGVAALAAIQALWGDLG